MKDSLPLIKEFVNVEQAYGLKKLGYDWPAFAYFIPAIKWGKIIYHDYGGDAFNMNDGRKIDFHECISAPLLQQAFRFLEVRYNVIPDLSIDESANQFLNRTIVDLTQKQNMIKDFITAINDSTCEKRVTVCEIYDEQGRLLVRESNRCNPDGSRCHRLGIVQNKENYDVNSHCNWTHAEIMAIRSLQPDSKPYKAIMYGHDFFCQSCEDELKKVGVSVFEVVSKIPII